MNDYEIAVVDDAPVVQVEVAEPTELKVSFLPRGERGEPGRDGRDGVDGKPGALTGTGRPDQPATTGGVITGQEPVGTIFTSTDGAGVGAWAWLKTATGWQVTTGDTGWHPVVTLDRGYIMARRTQDACYAVFDGYYGTAVVGTQTASVSIPDRPNTAHTPAWLIPQGFTLASRSVHPIYTGSNSSAITPNGYLVLFPNEGSTGYPAHYWIRNQQNTSTPSVTQATYQTTDPWPLSLPGTPTTQP